MSYTQQSIDDVRNADIVKVIGHFEELKKAGSLWECSSPFADDRTPSFKVKPSTNRWTCYSTNSSGDGIAFVMKKQNATFPEAIKTIASICGIHLQEEQVSEAVIKQRSEKEKMYGLMQASAIAYQKQLAAQEDNHWSKQLIADRQINQETIINFSIGFAPDQWKFLTNTIIDKGLLAVGKSTGLVTIKDTKSFDFFKNRLVFPIHNHNGKIVGFGGRCADTDDAVKGRKYINSKESDIYTKSKILYGLFQAKHAIVKSKTAVLVEGYTDVTGLHQNGCELAVATSGTALSNDQAKLLARFADHVIICRDNDGYDDKGNVKAGLKAALKDVNTLLLQGLKVSVVVLPEGEDPDSYSRKTEDINQYFQDNKMDGVLWKTNFLNTAAANNPDALSDAVTEVCKMLFEIKDDVKRNSYIDYCKKILKQPVKILKDKIESLKNDVLAKVEEAERFDTTTAEDLGLPIGADYEEFKKHRFCTVKNACFFQGRSQTFFKGTNYKIEPLFHVYGKNENKRLCEAVNEQNEKRIIDFDSADFVSRTKFEERLINEGFFVNLENFGANHFTLMKNRILSDFVLAFELKTLGWQREGFFAFADCVYHNNTIKNVDQYGIVQLENLKKTNSEYMDDVKHYYSPAFSEIYKHTRDDDDPYENDRYFVYKESPVTLKAWMRQLKKVYTIKAEIGIAFIFASIFRDIYIKRYQFFPHLFLTGEKGSGKSKFGESLCALFTYKQEPFDLNSGTPVAFYRRLSRTMNAPTMLEEFHDNIELKIFQSLKGAYDGRGREMGKATGDNRTTTTKVNSSLIITSQYISSRDDNSLTSRSLLSNFIKPLEAFTNEEVEDYNLLKSWEEEGLSSMVLDIVKHRPLIEKEIHKVYAQLNKKLKTELKGIDYQERMLQNYVCLLAPIKILWDQFSFPFTYEDIYNQFKEAIIDSSDLIIESEGLQEFWRTLEYLRDRQPFALLSEGVHYKIDTPMSLQLQTRKGEKPQNWTNDSRDSIIYLRLNAVHQLYHKEVSTREGVEVIGENTLRNYFKSKKYYIGSVKSHRFDDTSTSAYVFNYTMMQENGVLNLTRFKKEDSAIPDPGMFEPVQPEDDNQLPLN